jgi:hypothetical protein
MTVRAEIAVNLIDYMPTVAADQLRRGSKPERQPKSDPVGLGHFQISVWLVNCVGATLSALRPTRDAIEPLIEARAPFCMWPEARLPAVKPLGISAHSNDIGRKLPASLMTLSCNQLPHSKVPLRVTSRHKQRANSGDYCNPGSCQRRSANGHQALRGTWATATSATHSEPVCRPFAVKPE